MEKIIYGNLLLDGETYPFFLQGKVVCINQQPYQYAEKLHHYRELPSVRGVTSDNQHILFLNCRFRHGSITVFSIILLGIAHCRKQVFLALLQEYIKDHYTLNTKI